MPRSGWSDFFLTSTNLRLATSSAVSGFPGGAWMKNDCDGDGLLQMHDNQTASANLSNSVYDILSKTLAKQTLAKQIRQFSK